VTPARDDILAAVFREVAIAPQAEKFCAWEAEGFKLREAIDQGQVTKQEAGDCLQEVAAAHDLPSIHGQDTIQNRIVSAIGDCRSLGPLDEPNGFSSLDDFPEVFPDETAFPESTDDYGLSAPKIHDAPKPLTATPYVFRDPRTIPPRQWLYARHYVRKYVSATVGGSGLGKTSLTIVEALSMAAHRSLLGARLSPVPLRVWLWNGEDPNEELVRRIQAACLHHNLSAADIGDRLYLDSGRNQPCIMAKMTKSGVVIAEPVIDALAAEIYRRSIDVLIIDPFVSCHEVQENDNNAMDKVVKAWGRVAEGGNCSVELVHHLRKLGDSEATVEAARGAGAFVAGTRDVRVINVMSKNEQAQTSVAEAREFFRTVSGKTNMSPPSDMSDWYHLASVDLQNGPLGASDHVQAVESWRWPDPLGSITTHDLLAVQRRIGAGTWRRDKRSTNWVGRAIAEELRMNLDSAADHAKIDVLLKKWIGSGALKTVLKDDEHRKERVFIEVGLLATG
jgi:AAA domain-containing protein